MSSPDSTTVSADKKGDQTTLDIAATTTVTIEENHDVGAYRDDPSFQVHRLAQLSEDVLQNPVSTPLSVAALAEALSTPLSHVQELLHQLSPPSRKSTSSQNVTSGASDTSTKQPFWERPRSSRVALEQEDWELEPDHLFGQICIPVGDFKELSERRFTVIASRVNVRELRKRLRGQRDAVNDEIGRALQELRVSILHGGKQQLDELLAQYGALQELYETLRAEDDAYDLVEKGLIDQEWSLRLAEDAFYHHSSSLSTHTPTSIEGNSPAERLSRTPHSRSALQIGPDDSGFLTQRTDQVSEVELVREKLRHLESEYLELREEEELRITLGRTLDEDSSFALRVFSIRQAELLHYLSFYEERAAERQSILDHSIDQFPTHQYTGYDLEVLAREGVTDEQSGSPDIINTGMSSEETAALSEDPLLLSSPDEEVLDGQLSGQIPDTQDISTPRHLAYINDWLLYMLRRSKFAIMQLKNNFEDTTIFSDAQSFKSRVLSLWYTDETSTWYEESLEHAAQSYDSSSLSASIAQQLQATLSDPSLFLKRERPELVGQSRSVFVHRSEVKDLVIDLGGLAIGKGILRV